MTLYEVLYMNSDLRTSELLGVLPERRKDLRGKSYHEAGMGWARLIFGDLVRDEQAIFIVVRELKEVSEDGSGSGV